MRIMRFILGLVGFMTVWLTVAALIVLVAHAVFPGASGEFLGVNWAAIPGSVLGVVAGYRVYQIISGDRPRKADR